MSSYFSSNLTGHNLVSTRFQRWETINTLFGVLVVVFFGGIGWIKRKNIQKCYRGLLFWLDKTVMQTWGILVFPHFSLLLLNLSHYLITIRCRKFTTTLSGSGKCWKSQTAPGNISVFFNIPWVFNISCSVLVKMTWSDDDYQITVVTVDAKIQAHIKLYFTWQRGTSSCPDLSRTRHICRCSGARRPPTHTFPKGRTEDPFMQSGINIVKSWQKGHTWITGRATVEQVYVTSPSS